MRKLKKVMLVMLIGLILTPFVYVQLNKVIYANKVKKYLVEKQNYKENEIKSVKGVWGIKLPPFYATVVFEDEPYVEYIYFAHNDVLQFRYNITEEGNNKGITQSDLKHYNVPKY
ncbi:DUF3139 domain-containing protein [Paenibacillus elgii]|uniref:DUF3139 domain-containing protein n=1 Tax=Paenibacillus elgii TaxID=189691 RepID=UPI00203FDBE3|nr:DUF3139 domain-containing protein [Paenibacillus elgii]MCM3273592.1 DUF3139 domain-containing protein [Paenibacillus elgii]